MSVQKSISRGRESSRPAVDESASEKVVDRLAGLLPADALQGAPAGLGPEEITGPGGLVTQLAGRVLETALGAELTEHLGYRPGQAPRGGPGNTRNGSTSKRVHTELGTVEIKTPRDRNASFEPQLVGKRQTQLAGLDERVQAVIDQHDLAFIRRPKQASRTTGPGRSLVIPCGRAGRRNGDGRNHAVPEVLRPRSVPPGHHSTSARPSRMVQIGNRT